MRECVRVVKDAPVAVVVEVVTAPVVPASKAHHAANKVKTYEVCVYNVVKSD